MRFSFLAKLLFVMTASVDAFVPTVVAKKSFVSFTRHKMGLAIELPTKAIAGMKPGTSGLRKKVEIWQAIDSANKNYVENFIQSLLDTAMENNGGNMLHT